MFVALASIYSVVTPLGEGPDEPGHAAYVFFLAREGRLPVQRAAPETSDVPGEGHQPPLAYLLAAPLVAWLPRGERQIDLPGNPRFTWAGGAEVNAVAHGTREHWPWSNEVLAWHLARLVSVLCGAATVVLTYLAARSLDLRLTTSDLRFASRAELTHQSSIVNRQSSALLAAALVAFNPQFLFVSALVTNDALLVTLSAAMLWLAVRGAIKNRGPRTEDRGPRTENREPRTEDREPRTENQGPRTKDQGQAPGHSDRSAWSYAIVMGALLGLALLTKQSAIILVPIALSAIVIHSWSGQTKAQGGGKQGLLSSSHFVILSQVALSALVTLLICGWWYWRNWRVYGDPFGVAAFRAEFATQPFDPASIGAWAGALAQLHASFWGRFGWLNVLPPGWVIWLFTAIEAGAIAGWLLRPTIARSAAEPNGGATKESVARASIVSCLSRAGWWPLLALALLAFAWVISFALTAGLVAWQGRLMFPALPAIAIVLAWGLAVWGNRATAKGIQFLVLGSWFLVALWLPFGVIRPAYPFHTLSERVALAGLGTPVQGRYGLRGDPGAELRGWRLDGAARPGATLDLALMWHSLGRQNRAWTVFVHLVDANDTILTEDNRQPQDGAFPMNLWIAGDWIEDHHPLTLPAGIAPGSYTLRVGLYDAQSGERAGLFSPRGRLLGDYLDLGIVTVEAGG